MSNLRDSYKRRYVERLEPLARELEVFIKEVFKGFSRIDRIVARAKSVDRFVEKAQKKEGEKNKYTDPLNQIQDQVGARIVTFYKDDVEKVREKVLNNFRPIEDKMIVPDTESEFGYFGRHLILLYPSDIVDEDVSGIPVFFELQIKTLFQHAWSEANHDLGYKTTQELSPETKRRFAFVAAQAWGADEIFNEMFKIISGRSAASNGN